MKWFFHYIIICMTVLTYLLTAEAGVRWIQIFNIFLVFISDFFFFISMCIDIHPTSITFTGVLRIISDLWSIFSSYFRIWGFYSLIFLNNIRRDLSSRIIFRMNLIHVGGLLLFKMCSSVTFEPIFVVFFSQGLCKCISLVWWIFELFKNFNFINVIFLCLFFSILIHLQSSFSHLLHVVILKDFIGLLLRSMPSRSSRWYISIASSRWYLLVGCYIIICDWNFAQILIFIKLNMLSNLVWKILPWLRSWHHNGFISLIYIQFVIWMCIIFLHIFR